MDASKTESSNTFFETILTLDFHRRNYHPKMYHHPQFLFAVALLLLTLDVDAYFTCPATLSQGSQCIGQAGDGTTHTAPASVTTQAACIQYCQSIQSSATTDDKKNCCKFDNSDPSNVVCKLSDGTGISTQATGWEAFHSALCWDCSGQQNCVHCDNPEGADDPDNICDGCDTG